MFTCGFGSLPLLHGIRVGHRERGHGADGLSLLRVSSFGFQQRKPQPRRVALHRAPVLTWEDGADKRQEGEKTRNTEEVNKSKASRGLTLNIWSSHTTNEPERILTSKNRYFLIKMLQTFYFVTEKWHVEYYSACLSSTTSMKAKPFGLFMKLQIQIRFLIKTLSLWVSVLWVCAPATVNSLWVSKTFSRERTALGFGLCSRTALGSGSSCMGQKHRENTNMSVQQLQQDDLPAFFNESQPLQDSDVYRLPRSLSVDQQINTIII